jgi:hypothetical protein
MSSSPHFRKWIDFDATTKAAVVVSTPEKPESAPAQQEDPSFEDAILGFIDEARRAGAETIEEREPNEPSGSVPIQIALDATLAIEIGNRARSRRRTLVFGSILFASLMLTASDTRSLCMAIDDGGSTLVSFVRSAVMGP